MNRDKKNSRILTIYEDLRTGRIIRKDEAARRFGVDGRTIQRDIDDLRAFLAEKALAGESDLQITYDRGCKGYRMTGEPSPLMTNSEILAISKILLESRAFPKSEMTAMLDKLVAGCVPQDNSKLVRDLLANEKFHYMELSEPVHLQDRLWELGCAIRNRKRLRVCYRRQGERDAGVNWVVEPVAILFSEYYFYLLAYVTERDSYGSWVHRHDWPSTFRVDRIQSCQEEAGTFALPYANRFQEGEFRQRVQFMYSGELRTIRFRYSGPSVQAVLDRLPTARIERQEGESWFLQVEVYGDGIFMWLLSQGDRVEVLSPPSLRSRFRELLLDTLKFYGQDG